MASQEVVDGDIPETRELKPIVSASVPCPDIPNNGRWNEEDFLTSHRNSTSPGRSGDQRSV
jgi:hypothetical protein